MPQQDRVLSKIPLAVPTGRMQEDMCEEELGDLEGLERYNFQNRNDRDQVSQFLCQNPDIEDFLKHRLSHVIDDCFMGCYLPDMFLSLRSNGTTEREILVVSLLWPTILTNGGEEDESEVEVTEAEESATREEAKAHFDYICAQIGQSKPNRLEMKLLFNE